MHLIFTAMNLGRFLFWLWVALALLGCQSTAHDDDKTVFRYNESNSIASLDPAFASDLETMWLVNQLYDGLVSMDDSLRIIPCLAQSWSISEDGLTYQFVLRSDVFFHSMNHQEVNRKLVAADVLFSFQRIMDSQLASPGQWIFQNVQDNGFQVLNDTIVQIHLKEPQGSFLSMLTTQYANVVCPEAVAQFGMDFRKHPIGTGPFKMAFWEDQIGIVFHKFENYWMRDEMGNSLPYLDAIHVDLVKDPFAEFQGVVSGKYDFMSGVHPSFLNELLTKEGNLDEQWKTKLNLFKMPFIKTDYIGCYLESLEEPMVMNPLYRKALSMAIPREELCAKLRNHLIVPAYYGFVPPVLDGDHEMINELLYSPDSVRLIVQKLQVQYGQPLPSVILATTPEFVDIYEFLQFKWQELGIPMQIKVMQSAAFKDATAKGQVPLFRKNWLADFPDAENFLQVFTKEQWSPKGPNYTHFYNEGWERAFYATKKISNADERRGQFKQLDRQIAEELPVIPLYYDQVIHVVGKHIQNWPINGINLLDLTRVKKSSYISR
jgi:peptide/nickel transport system substrate-binding protein